MEINYVIWFGAILGSVLVLVHAIWLFKGWKPLYDEHNGLFYVALSLVVAALCFILRSIFYTADMMNALSGNLSASSSQEPFSVLLIILGELSALVLIIMPILHLIGVYDKPRDLKKSA